MYRALTWLAMREGLPLGEASRSASSRARNPVTFDEAGRVFIAGTDVTSAIRQSRSTGWCPSSRAITRCAR